MTHERSAFHCMGADILTSTPGQCLKAGHAEGMGEGEIGWRNPCFASVALLTETPTAPVLMKIQVKTISGQVDSLEVAEDCTARGSFFFRLGWPPLSHRVRAWDGTLFRVEGFSSWSINATLEKWGLVPVDKIFQVC